jgi:hypothetical protein
VFLMSDNENEGVELLDVLDGSLFNHERNHSFDRF